MLWLEALLLRVPTRTIITNKSMIPRIMKANIMFLHLFDCETVGSIFPVSQKHCESLAATECFILHDFTSFFEAHQPSMSAIASNDHSCSSQTVFLIRILSHGLSHKMDNSLRKQQTDRFISGEKLLYLYYQWDRALTRIKVTSTATC